MGVVSGCTFVPVGEVAAVSRYTAVSRSVCRDLRSSALPTPFVVRKRRPGAPAGGSGALLQRVKAHLGRWPEAALLGQRPQCLSGSDAAPPVHCDRLPMQMVRPRKRASVPGAGQLAGPQSSERPLFSA